MDGVEPQAVEVEVPDPPLRALQDPLADGVAPLVVVVERLAPEGVVPVGEVGPVRLDGLDAGRPEMVVDDVQHDAQPASVRGVDEALEPSGPP
jgi:hypothetical protein